MSSKTECGRADDMALTPEEIAEAVKAEVKKVYESEEERESLLVAAMKLLAENDWRLERLEKTNPVWRVISGLKSRTGNRLQVTFNELHRITIELVTQLYKDQTELRKTIRQQSVENQNKSKEINNMILGLMEVLDDLQGSVKVGDIERNLKNWLCDYQNDRDKKGLPEEPCQRLLSMVLGWHRINPDGRNSEEYRSVKKSTIKELDLEDKLLSPQDFVDVFWEDSDRLEPYVEKVRSCQSQSDAENVELSKYGQLICEIYDLCSSQQVHNLKTASPKEIEKVCGIWLDHYIKKNHVEPAKAETIFNDLLKDLQEAFRCETKLLEKKKQEIINQKNQEEEERVKKLNDEKVKQRKKEEEQKKYRLAVVSPEGSWLYGLDRSDSWSFISGKRKNFSLSENRIEEVDGKLQKFQPSLAVVPDAFKVKQPGWFVKLGVPKVVSLSDFYYCLWQSGLSGTKNHSDLPDCVVLFDRYEKRLWTSCFRKREDGKFDCYRREQEQEQEQESEQKSIRSNKTPKRIEEEVIKWLRGSGLNLSEKEEENIVYCRTSPIEKKNIDNRAELMEREWQDKLRDPANLRKVMDKLLLDEQKKEDM